MKFYGILMHLKSRNLDWMWNVAVVQSMDFSPIKSKEESFIISSSKETTGGDDGGGIPVY